MAATKPASKQAGGASRGTRAGKKPVVKKPVVLARVTARRGSEAARAACREAAGMPGWRAARAVLGEALAAGATGLLLEARGQGVVVRQRTGTAWQAAEPLPADATAALAALAKLAVPPAGGADVEFTMAAPKRPRRACRVARRTTVSKGEQVVVLVGRELPATAWPRPGRVIAAALGRLVPSFLVRKPPPPERDPTLPVVALEAVGPDAAARQEEAIAADAYPEACDFVAEALRARAGEVVIEAGPQALTVQYDVDGVRGAGPVLDKASAAGIVGVLRGVAGLDPRSRTAARGRCTVRIDGKAWGGTVAVGRGVGGDRMRLVLDYGRPKFKSLADLGMTEAVAGRVRECLALDRGLLVLAAPLRGGLSSLFDGVVGAADRLLRDFVLLEDAAEPRPEIQNVKPMQWNAAAGTAPVAALEAALRDYPNVLATCDLEDAALAARLVAQAGEGRLVIVGVRGEDAAAGLAHFAALAGDPAAVARELLGAVGTRLVRKLCPKCRQEYVPPVEALVRLRLDPDVVPTLFRPASGGCPVCTTTGYLGRTGVHEFAAGPTLKAHLAKGADAAVLRQAATKDGMVSVQLDAIARAAAGTTAVEEVQRVFRRE